MRPNFEMSPEDIEKAYWRMTSMEPYHCPPFNNPPQLKTEDDIFEDMN